MKLKGKIFISTVSSARSFEMRNIFEPLGARLINFPMTECIESDMTPDMQKVLSEVVNYQWIIFTSANGVRHFHNLFSETTGLTAIPFGIKIAVVGPKTALELKNKGRTADYTGSGGTADSLMNELIEKKLVHNCRVLFPLGNRAPDIRLMLTGIAESIRINVYKTVKADFSDNSIIEKIRNNLYDLVIFTSPSGVDNFIETIGTETLNTELRVACIGKVTTRAVTRYGIKSLVTAETSTYEGLANEILNYYKINN
jgi:uroporphyrinogen-III synthase